MQGRASLAPPCMFSRPHSVATSSLLAIDSRKCYTLVSVNLKRDAMASAFVRDKHSVYGLTHVLCIPITTPQSRPQLQKTLHQFSKDPCTSRIPSGAYRPLQTLHIPIRTLSLQTQDRIEAACHHLRSLDIDGLLRRTSETTPGTTNNVREMHQELASVHQGNLALPSSTRSKSPSLTITLSGVCSKPLLAQEGLYPDRGSLNWRLKTSCADSTSRLRPFLDEIRRCFDVSGFQIPGARPRNPEYLVILLSTMHAWSRSKNPFETPRNLTNFELRTHHFLRPRISPKNSKTSCSQKVLGSRG